MTKGEEKPDGLVMIRVLGPVDLVGSRGPVAVPGRLERKLLAGLVLSVNHLVSTDQLAYVLWGEHPPPKRDNALHAYISRLRHQLGHERLLSKDHGYVLVVDHDEIDALVFETAVMRAASLRDQPEKGLILSKKALSLWRGVPFGDFADEAPFRLESIRLDELRLFTMELQLEFELGLGMEELVVGALEGLVEEHPYRERMWYLLASALSRSGRRVESLRACARLRDLLAEAGLGPTEEMMRLEDEILQEGPEVRPRLH